MTNYERIKNMSVDEIATVISDKEIKGVFCEYYSSIGYDENSTYRGCAHCDDFGRYTQCPFRYMFGGCGKDKIVKWLKNEVEE